jgi:hypothetical protein
VNVTDAPARRPARLTDAGLALPPSELLAELRRRSQQMHGRGRVAEALYALALDLVGDDSDLEPAERKWLTDALATPVSEAAYEAIDTLLHELALTLGSAPPRVRPVLAQPAALRRIDFE